MTQEEHRRLQEDIPAYVGGSLEEATCAVLETHVACCAECEDWVLRCEEIAATIVAEADPKAAAHPAPLRLRDFSRLNAVDGSDIARHVERCRTCSLEVAMWRKHSALAPEARPWTWSWPALKPLLAASVGGAVLTATFFLAYERGLGPADKTSWHGPSAFLLLDGAPRGNGAIPTVALEVAQPFLPVGVHVVIPEEIENEEPIRFTIESSDGRIGWEETIPAGEVRAEVSRAWVVGFLVPAPDHPPGRYRLRASTGTSSDAVPLMEIPFEIAPRPGATPRPR